ncbi:MAG: helix-turn-helix domain-containing protein [Clostridia bacterium]|nr:helix-turn-helix domain-containing protein [Clostridia bacterium]
MDKKKIGEFLKKLRKAKGLTQDKFACKFSKSCFGDIGLVSDAAISKWERGESLPSIKDIQLLSHFYGVTVDEILNGENFVDDDFNKKYFLANPLWVRDFPKDAPLYEIREKQELEIESRFKALLKKMISEGLTLSENAEFDYLVANFYIVYTNDESEDFSVVIKNVKFQISKTVALMHNSSLDEKFWEVYKLFESRFRQKVKKDVCNEIEDAEDILRERVSNLEVFEKDMLLATIQVENVTNIYGIQDRNQAQFTGSLESLYEKTYNRPYDEEQLTKNAIKLLVECGARLNPLLFGYQRDKVKKINVLDRLIELYSKFKKPLIIPVFEDAVYSFYEVENTPVNRKLLYLDDTGEMLDEAEYLDLESMLYEGKRILDKIIHEWVGGKTEDEMLKYMWSVISDLSLNDYLMARDERLTNDLVDRLNELSLEDIRLMYFNGGKRKI